MRFLRETNSTKSITTILAIVVMLVFLSTSCGKDKEEAVDVAFDPEMTYTMKATDISALISDSGMIRFRAIADLLYMYTKAAEPYWFFPQSVYVEKYDSLLQVEASITADTAYHYTNKGLWELIGNVEVISQKGEHFETEHLFWDQKEKRVYSEKYIRIENAERIITGIGFESNETMTKYDVFNSQGVFPVKETPQDSTAVIQPADSLAVIPDNQARKMVEVEKK